MQRSILCQQSLTSNSSSGKELGIPVDRAFGKRQTRYMDVEIGEWFGSGINLMPLLAVVKHQTSGKRDRIRGSPEAENKSQALETMAQKKRLK